MTYIEISDGGAFVRLATDSADDIAVARLAMAAAGIPRATIWEAADPHGPDRTDTGNTLIAAGGG